MDKQINEQVCCPRFEPGPWDGNRFDWVDKKFVKDRVCTFFYMPMNFGAVMTKLAKKIEQAGGNFVEGMSLSDHTSKWNMDLYLAVDKEIPGAENVTLSGKFLSKVYEGNFKDFGTWMKDFENYAKEQGSNIEKMYMWYTTCPKCAKKYGKNYVVIVGKEI